METSEAKISNVRRKAVEAQAPAAVTTDSNGRQTVIDARGRKLTLRELSLLDEQDLFIAMGPEASGIPMVLGRALLAARIAIIDGDPVPVPRNNTQYRGMLLEVGKDGLAAVMSVAEADNGDEQASEIETVKN